MSRLKVFVIGVVMVLFGSTALTIATPTTSAAQGAGCQDTFLGFPAWYKGLTTGSDCSIKAPGQGSGELAKFIWRIALNVLEIVLRIIGILAVAFIIYGGFQYLTSSGSPERAAGAMKTIVNASVGLVIALGVMALQNLIWDIVTVGSSNDYGVYTGSTSDVVESALNLVFYVGGAIAVVMIIISGLNYITSSGDPGKMTKAKNTLLYAIVGLVVIIAAWTITKFIVDRF